MGKKKHQFINKKNSHKFNVVYRSQRDPLQPDEESSQHVLVPADGMSDVPGASTSNKNIEERVRCGIYYDDDYDYLQHLRPRGEGMFIMAEDPVDRNPSRGENLSKINLPTESLPSTYEVDIGMLNKGVLPRGPQPDWDPDIVAALDDDVDFDDPDNMLADDFINLANAEGYASDEEYEDEFTDEFGRETNTATDMERNFTEFHLKKLKKDENDFESDSDVSSTGNFGSDDFSDFDDSEEETKSRFTNYSMTSSVIRRTEGLKLLDDHFERIMEEYDEEEIGAVEHEETTGTFNVNDELITQIVDEFIDNLKPVPLSEAAAEGEAEAEIGESDNEEEMENDDELFKEFEKKPSEKWDCESIISTYSNIYNHPKLIEEQKVIRLHKKTGVPLGVLKDDKQKESENRESNCNEVQFLNNIRKKGETPDERRIRKQEIKEQRKNRRKEKKENTLIFKDEHKKQELIVQNKMNQMGIKI